MTAPPADLPFRPVEALQPPRPRPAPHVLARAACHCRRRRRRRSARSAIAQLHGRKMWRSAARSGGLSYIVIALPSVARAPARLERGRRAPLTCRRAPCTRRHCCRASTFHPSTPGDSSVRIGDENHRWRARAQRCRVADEARGWDSRKNGRGLSPRQRSAAHVQISGAWGRQLCSPDPRHSSKNARTSLRGCAGRARRLAARVSRSQSPEADSSKIKKPDQSCDFNSL